MINRIIVIGIGPIGGIIGGRLARATGQKRQRRQQRAQEAGEQSDIPPLETDPWG